MAEDSIDPVAQSAAAPRRRLRPKLGHVIFLIIAVLATLALAWWQWSRFRSGSGTFQNLGYAFQWPAFGAFMVYGYRKYLQMEANAADAEANVGDDPDYIYEAPKIEQAHQVTEIDAAFLPERPTMDVSEFNARNRPRRGVEDLDGLNDSAPNERKV